MKNRTLGFLATISMLMAPAINGMAGYNFHFDAQKPAWTFNELLQPDRFYTEHIQSKNTRPNQKYIDEFYEYKESMGIKVPVILTKKVMAQETAGAQESIGFPGWHISRIYLNEQLISEKESSSFPYYRAWSKTVLPHEAEHARRGHSGRYHFWEVTDILAHAACLGATTVAYKTKKPSHVLAATTLFLASFYTRKKWNEAFAEISDLQVRRTWEYQAEEGALNALAKKGECDALENILIQNKITQKHYAREGQENLRHGDFYPTKEEYIALTRAAHNACRTQQAQQKN